MENPVVTIVTPSLNQGKFIRATIESVLSQDYPNIEYIIMDGGSTDETVSIASEYSSRLRWISERDRGQSDAINKGFRMASGGIVSWLNSDDSILPGAVTLAVKALTANPDAAAVYGEGYVMDEVGCFKGRFPHTQPLNLWRLVHLSDYILQQTVYFRKTVFDEVGYLDEDLNYTMDWDILIRIAKRRRLVHIPEYMGCIREYAEAKTSSGGAARIREIRDLLGRHTGMSLPPGYIVYGLETYRNIWCEEIRKRTPAAWSGASQMLQHVVNSAAGHIIDRTLSQSQGLYSDGWAAKRARIMLPASSATRVLIRGLLPSCPIARQKIAIRIGQANVARHTVRPGAFEIGFDVPLPFRGHPLDVTLLASRSFVVSAPHRRRLSYILKDCEYAPPR